MYQIMFWQNHPQMKCFAAQYLNWISTSLGFPSGPINENELFFFLKWMMSRQEPHHLLCCSPEKHTQPIMHLTHANSWIRSFYFNVFSRTRQWGGNSVQWTWVTFFKRAVILSACGITQACFNVLNVVSLVMSLAFTRTICGCKDALFSSIV